MSRMTTARWIAGAVSLVFLMSTATSQGRRCVSFCRRHGAALGLSIHCSLVSGLSITTTMIRYCSHHQQRCCFFFFAFSSDTILDSWVSFEESEYFFSLLERSWFEARDSCRQASADLTSVTSQQEQGFVIQHIDK